MAHDIALYHHEKWDGSGYNRGCAGEKIPLPARIVAVADVLDALLAERSYKPTWTFDDGYAEVLRLSGTHFDPECVAALISCKDQVQSVYQQTESKIQVA